MKEKELAKFVDWLVQSGESPEGASFDETVSWINELATSEEGQQILGRLIQTYKNKEMGIFKEGGKLGYLLCLKKGGSIQDCGCGKKIEKAQGGEKVGYTDEQRAAIKKGNYKNNYTDPYGNNVEEYSGNFGGDQAVFSRLVTPQNDTLYSVKFHDEYNNYEPFYGYEREYFKEDPDSRIVQNFNKHRERLNRGPVDINNLQKTQDALGEAYMINEFNPTQVKTRPQTKPVQTAPVVSMFRGLNQPAHSYPIVLKEGGDVNKDPRVTRKETKDVAKEGLGYTNKEFRSRYRDEKRKANGDRQKARWAIIDDVYPRAEIELPVINDDIQIEDYNIEFSPEARDLAPQELGVTIQGYNEHMGDKRFKDAFRRARKYGLKEFEWNGKRYNTNLRGPESAQIVTSELPSIPVYIPENKKSLIENLKAAIINNAPYMK